MASVVSVACLKGGVGKSTVATNLAVAFHEAGRRVLVVDADPQGTATYWADAARAAGHAVPPVLAIHGRTLRAGVERAGAAHDLVVVDLPPRAGAEAASALLASHVAILPVCPGGADVWALAETLELVSKAQAAHPALRAVTLASRVDGRTAFTRQLRSTLRGLPVPPLRASLGQRVTYAEAMTAGQGATTYAPRSSAAREVRALASEVAALLTAKRTKGARRG